MSEQLYTSGTGGLTRIYDGVEGVLPGVAHNMVMLAAWDAIEEFCLRSTYWRMSLPFVIPAGDYDRVQVGIDANTVVAAIIAVHGLHSYRIAPPDVIIDPTTPGGGQGGGVGASPVGDTGIGGSAFTAPADRFGGALVICKPSSLAAPMPSFLVDQWNEALRDGILARLYRHPSKPYSSPQLAGMHGQRFRNQILLARDMARRFNDYPGPRFPYFARGNQHSYAWGAGDYGSGNQGIGA
jgi:hypothetical protein